MMTDGKKDVALNDFRNSWNQPREFYMSAPARWDLHLMPPIISQLQELGYDNIFRAGMCLGTLILSRSRAHGLRSDQPYISIVPNLKGGLQVQYCSGGYPFSENQIVEEINTNVMEITVQIGALLKCLTEYPID